PKLPKRPAFASGTINLSIPPATRKLTIAATPRDKELEPGGETTVDVELRDASGKPARNAEVALVVVDESVLALTGYQLADPLNTFYYQRGADVRNHHSREQVQLANTDVLISQTRQAQGAGGGAAVKRATRASAGQPPPAAAAPMAEAMQSDAAQKPEGIETKEFEDKAKAGGEDTPIQTRIDFNALAFFAASLPTD